MEGNATLSALAAVLPLAAAAVHAQPPEVPALVRAAQDAARQDLQRPLALRAQTARVAGAWGFVVAELRNADGAPFDFAGTRLEEAAREGYVSRQYVALLARRDGTWQVVESRVGATDVAWEGWAARFNAPAQLFAP